MTTPHLSTGSKLSTGYVPALDGMRAVSILLVVASHAGLDQFIPGELGVIIFFVISGYLITSQLIDEIRSTAALNIKAFYTRRLLRLAPALLIYITLFSILPLAMRQPLTIAHVFSGIFYVANYFMAFIGYPPLSPFPILWSLAIEEHFYILFHSRPIKFGDAVRSY